MSITSITFALFLFASVIVFYICPVKYRWIILLGSSIAFYAISGLTYLPFILFTSITVWWGGCRVGKVYTEQDEKLNACTDRKEKKNIKAAYKGKAKLYLMLVMLANILLLCAVKFAKYFIPGLNSLLSISGLFSGEITAEMIIVPLGVSYYTFSTVGYLLDVYWRRYTYEPNILRFVLYTIYFPHIVQGPISRYNSLGQELKKELRWDYDRVCQGLQLMLWGLFKKLVIADALNVFVNNVYADKKAAGMIYFIAMLFDAAQIYTDFTGYMDIVTGASQIFGVKLERNFNHPFFSKSVTEFWRRWHMTMGGWFKDYVYYPLTMSGWLKSFNKNTRGKLPDIVRKYTVTAIPILITWFLTGLWHGTGSTYVAWGIYYGVLITLSTIFTESTRSFARMLHINMDAHSFDIFRMIRMFFLFCGGRLLTRPGSLHNTLHVVKSMLVRINPWVLWDGSLYEYGLKLQDIIVVLLGIVLVWWVSYHEETKEPVRETLAKSNLVFRWILLLGLIFSIIIFGQYGPGFNASSFIYAAY